jgi:hypothetical protein
MKLGRRSALGALGSLGIATGLAAREAAAKGVALERDV